MFKWLKKIVSPKEEKSHEDWAREGDKYLNMGNYEKAIECYIKALEEDSKDPITWFNLAYAYFNLENYELALEAIDTALEIAPGNPEFSYLKGLIYYKLGQYNKAYDYLLKASKRIKRSDLYEMLGEISIKYRRYDEALDYYLKAYKLNEKNTNALFMAGKLYLMFGDVDNAYDMFKKVLERDVNHKCRVVVECMDRIVEIINTNTYEDIESGVRLIEGGDYVGALKIFNKILQVDKTNDFAYYYKSVIAEIFEEYQKGLDNINKALSLLDRSIYYAKKGDILSKLGDFEAIDAYNKSIELNPNPYAYFGLAIHHYRNKNYIEASKFFDRILEMYVSDFPKDDMDIFTIYSLIGKAESTSIPKYYEGALSYIDNLLEKDPENKLLWKIRGYIYYKLKNYREAHECYMNAFRIDTKDVEILKSLIVVYEKSEKYDEALSMANRLLKILQNQEAEEIVKKLINREPTNLEISSPLQEVPVMYYKPSPVCYHLVNLFKCIIRNPIEAYVYLSFVADTYNIYSKIEDEEKIKILRKLIDKLKKLLPIEMYKYCESPDNYKPNEEIVDLCKEEFKKFECVL